MLPRIIPCLLLKDAGLVKTRQFKNPVYLGDPVNVIKIFNTKEVDELILLDITATVEKRAPRLKLLSEIASECFMPLAYGGGVRTMGEIETIYRAGFEKVILNTAAVENPGLITEAAKVFGSQSVVVSIDARRRLFGRYEVSTHSGRVSTALHPADWARRAEEAGAGEIFIQSIDRDGTMEGYDFTLLNAVASSVTVPVIACGGAGNLSDLVRAIREGGASAACAGSMFVFHGRQRGVLINVPNPTQIRQAFAQTESPAN